MVFVKIWILFVIAVHLKFGLTAPCHTESTKNSTECQSRSVTKLDPLSRLLMRRNITDEGRLVLDSLLSILLSEATGALFNDQEIVFPDSFSAFANPIPRISATPRCANGLSFCEEIDSYPYGKVRKLLPKGGEHSEFFGVDEAPPEIANRIGNPDENFICASIASTVFPKAARNKNNKWKYIINQGENEGYIQGIRIEKCLKLSGACNLVADAPVGYVARCKQKYILRRLLSLSDGGEAIPDSFHIPSACCCSFKKDFSFLTGFGRSATTSTLSPS